MGYLIVTKEDDQEIQRINEERKYYATRIEPVELEDGMLVISDDLLGDCEQLGMNYYHWKDVLKSLSKFDGEPIFKISEEQ